MSRCEYCHRSGEHDTHCPLWSMPKYIPKCAKCHEGIWNGDKYVKLDNGLCHVDCLEIEDLLNEIGLEVKTMNEEM